MSNTTFKFKRGLSAGAIPVGLTFGEPAINTIDGRLFVGNVTGGSIPINAKYFSDISPPSSPIQGDKWFTGGSEYTWINGDAGGSWMEIGNYVSSSFQFRQYISIKDFGAKGDGSTDDTSSIQSALDSFANSYGSLTGDKFILFPPGNYMISPSRTVGTALSSCLFARPSAGGSMRLLGNNATLTCTGSAHASHMMWLQPNGNDVFIDGINFDGNNKSVYGLKVEEQTQSYIGSAKISNCKFTNLYIPSTNPYSSLSFNEATGLMLIGPFNNMIIDKCAIKNVSRARVTTGVAGSCGISITYSPIGGQNLGVKTATISSCYVENVTNSELPTYGNLLNVDCDGLKFFGGNTTGNNYINCRASIYGNHFVNCAGRDIKIQADEVTIQANTSSLNILPIQGGGSRINCQISSGIVSNNVFHFDQVTGSSWLSPFIEDGGLTAGGNVISFFDGQADDRNRTITVTDNHVFNNVPQGTGKLAEFFGNTEGDTSPRPPAFVTIQGNKVVGKGACTRFASIAGRDASSNPIYYTINDNMVSTITGGNTGQTGSFMTAQNSAFNNTIMHIHGNVQSGANPVSHLVNSTDLTTVMNANINAHSNWGIGLSANMSKASGQSFIPRMGMISDPLTSEGGTVCVQSTSLTDGGIYTFPYKGTLGYGAFRMLTVAKDETAMMMFVNSSNTLVPLYSGSSIASASTANPGTAGKINVWLSNTVPGYQTTTVSVQNKLGDGVTRVINLYTFG